MQKQPKKFSSILLLASLFSISVMSGAWAAQDQKAPAEPCESWLKRAKNTLGSLFQSGPTAEEIAQEAAAQEFKLKEAQYPKLFGSLDAIWKQYSNKSYSSQIDIIGKKATQDILNAPTRKSAQEIVDQAYTDIEAVVKKARGRAAENRQNPTNPN